MASKKTAKLEQLAQARAQRSNAAAASSTSMSTLEDTKISKKEANKEQLTEARANKEQLAEAKAKHLTMALSLENLQNLLSDSEWRLQHANAEISALRSSLESERIESAQISILQTTTMPSKSSRSTAQVQQMLSAKVDAARGSPVAMGQLQNLLERSEERLEKAEREIGKLKVALAEERENSRRLQEELDVKAKNCDELAYRLSLEEERSAQRYQALRVERRARQRGQARKGVLESQIKLLHSADSVQSYQLKNVRSNASKAIDALLKMEKENFSLRSELSRCLKRCRREVKEAQIKTYNMAQNWRQSKMLAAKLQKHCM